jgi:uncharacterized glyoxalase superfamily protein PhnB
MPAKKKAAKRARPKAKVVQRRAVKKARVRQAKKLVRRKEPETLRLRAAAPSLTVGNVEASLAWYRDVLGFTLGERWEHEGKLAGVELVAGSVSFYLSQDDWQKGRDRAKGIGFRLYCTTAQDVDRLAADIKARGGSLLQEPHDEPWGGRMLAVADPDGFKITIAST